MGPYVEGSIAVGPAWFWTRKRYVRVIRRFRSWALPSS